MTKIIAKTIKWTRKGGQRRKTGCPTCRARHVKCDETKPSCLNCTSTGRKCDGYDSSNSSTSGTSNTSSTSSTSSTPSTSSTSSPKQAALLMDFTQLLLDGTSPWNDSRVTLARTLGLPANAQSNRFFHTFLHGCVPALTEAMDSQFWQRSIQKASYSPAVKYAVVALGAVYEQNVAYQNQHGSLIPTSLELVSSARYATAIQFLQSRIADLSKAPEIFEEVMVACLIFIFIEILRGEDVAAVTHLDGALELYSHAQPGGRTLTYVNEDKASDTNDILEGLTKAFLRLDLQSVMYMGSRTPWHPDGITVWFHTIEDVPATFETFLDARDNFYAHLAKIINFTTPPEGADKCFPEWTCHSGRGFDVYTVFHGSTYRDFEVPNAGIQRRHFMRVLSRWASAFRGFLQKGSVKTREALMGCALLWMSYYTTRINLAVSYTKDEYCYDEHLPSFKKLVEQAEAYLKYTGHELPAQRDGNEMPPGMTAGRMPSLKPKRQEFNPYPTVCYPLYYTVLKCRYEPLRQHALRLLRNSKNEGVWDSQMLARIAELVINVEGQSFESNPDDAIPSDVPHFGVPEANRIHCLALNIDKVRRVVWLKYNRRVDKMRGDISGSNRTKQWNIDEATLTWDDGSKARMPCWD